MLISLLLKFRVETRLALNFHYYKWFVYRGLDLSKIRLLIISTIEFLEVARLTLTSVSRARTFARIGPRRQRSFERCD